MQLRHESLFRHLMLWRSPKLMLSLILICLALVESSCCRSFSLETKRKDEAAQKWLHAWSGHYDWKPLPEWRSVPESKMPQAELLLRDAAVVGLTKAQALDLLSESSQASTGLGVPYLLRAVGPIEGRLPLEVLIRHNGDIWVGGEAIGRCRVPIERRAVLAWLDRTPSEV
jgi:hypothetical protein